MTFKGGPEDRTVSHPGKQSKSFLGARIRRLWGLCGRAGDVGDYRETDRGQITWDLRCQGKRVWILLSGHGRPLGIEFCCSFMLLQVKPSGHELFNGSYQN